MTFRLPALIGVVALVATVAAQTPANPRSEKMTVFAPLIGSWDLTAEEHNSSGQSFAQRGTRTCSWVLDGAAIRMETELEVTRADPDYAQLPKRRVFVSYLTFNPQTNLYEYLDLFGSPRPVIATTDPLGFSYHFVLFLPRKNATLDAHNRWWFEGPALLRNETRLVAADGSFSELYRAELRRRD